MSNSPGTVDTLPCREPCQTPEAVPLAFERNFNAADLDGLLALYGAHSVFVPAPGMPLQEPARIRDGLARFLAIGLPIHINLRQVYRSAGTALIVFDWQIRGTDPAGQAVDMAGTGTDVVVQQPDGAWIYAVDNPFGVAGAAHS